MNLANFLAAIDNPTQRRKPYFPGNNRYEVEAAFFRAFRVEYGLDLECSELHVTTAWRDEATIEGVVVSFTTTGYIEIDLGNGARFTNRWIGGQREFVIGAMTFDAFAPGCELPHRLAGYLGFVKAVKLAMGQAVYDE
jgi:hypothetical protein